MAQDVLNRPIRPNQIVAYPVQTTKGLAMSIARVIAVEGDNLIKLQTQRKNGTTYMFNFTHLDRVAIIQGMD